MIRDYKENGLYKETSRFESVGREEQLVRNNSIATEVTDLRDLVSKAHELFTILEQRTEPFRQRVPQMQEKDATPGNGGSEIRANLADQNDRLRALICRINTVIEEIDL